MDYLDLEAPGLTAGNVEKIAALFPAAVTETRGADGKVKKAVNFEVLKQLLAPDVAEGEDRYEFTWVGKRAAMAEAARPTSRTLRPVKADSRDWDTTRNLYIEGDNLEVLKILQESYLGAVKVIYLDPPYNTGSDFIYPDSFVMDRGVYHGASGYRDAEGKINFQRKNTFSDGRYHSDWCSMLFSRLLLARSLLSPDGVILLSIDDHESANLKKICDEVFGESNYLNQFAWVSNITGRQISGRGAAKTWESVLAYARDIDACGSLSIDIRFAREKMPDAYKGFRRDVRTDRLGPFAVGDPLYNHNRKFNEETRPNLVFSIFYQPQTQEISTGAIGERRPGWVELPPHANGDGVHKYHAWRWSRQKIADEPYNLIVLPTASGGYEIHTKIRDFGRTLLKDVIPDIPNGDAELRKLFGGRKLFDYPKSVDLLRTLIGSVPGKDFVCLDLFSGSATTAHAVMRLNAEDGGRRSFIMVQLPEPCGEKSEAAQAGFQTICEIGKARIRRAGDQIRTEFPGACPDIGCRVFRGEEGGRAGVRGPGGLRRGRPAPGRGGDHAVHRPQRLHREGSPHLRLRGGAGRHCQLADHGAPPPGPVGPGHPHGVPPLPRLTSWLRPGHRHRGGGVAGPGGGLLGGQHQPKHPPDVTAAGASRQKALSLHPQTWFPPGGDPFGVSAFPFWGPGKPL